MCSMRPSVSCTKQTRPPTKEAMMKKFCIVAYAECDESYLPRREKIITARNHSEAMSIAWREFPEYHEIGAFEVEDA